ncbi:MAG: hypothetical protein KAG97_04945 [Victivallales bacterium]|nr:hypothetical protein [Victivallales bacterium]
MRDLIEILELYPKMGDAHLFLVYGTMILCVAGGDALKSWRWSWRNKINLVVLLSSYIFSVIGARRLWACYEGAFVGLVDEWIIRVLLGYQTAVTILDFFFPAPPALRFWQKNSTERRRRSCGLAAENRN